MNKKRISYRLSIYIFTIAVIVMSAIVLINYEYSKRLLMGHIEENAINQSKLIINEVSRPIVTSQEITRNVANQALYYLKNDDLEFFLKQVLIANKSLSGVHVSLFPEFTGNPDTSMYSAIRQDDQIITPLRGEDGFNYRLVNSSEPYGWSEPYQSPYSKNKSMLSYRMPIIGYEQTDTIGSVYSEMELDLINSLISSIRIGKEGIAFMIDHDGLFLTHPHPNWALHKNIFELPDRVFPEDASTFRAMLDAGQYVPGIIYPESFNFRKSWFYYAPMPYTNWTLIIIIPIRELFYDLWVVFRQIVSVAIIGLALIVILFIWVLRKTLQPLVQVTKDIQQFSMGGDTVLPVQNEIVSLVDSLEVMQTRYAELLSEQNQSKKDRRNFEKDMKSAKEIQSGIIPSGYPAFPDRSEIDLYAVLSPAQIIGGDLYDYFFIDKNHLLFAMGDVSGKGIPASLFMAVAHTLIKGNSTVMSSKHIVEIMNEKLSHRNVNQHFITLFVGILDVENGILDYCNAAHNYPYLLRKSGEVEILDETHGLPAGVYPNKTYGSSSKVLKSGDLLFLYTDGVIDCRDMNDQIYGQQLLEQNLNAFKNLSSKDLVQKIEASLKIFKGTNKQSDDISLMALQFLK